MKHNGKNNFVEALIYRAIESLGWVLPTTEEEVASAKVDESMELPVELLDPLAALSVREQQGVASIKMAAESDEVIEELAQAARQGIEKIPRHTLEAMRRDRERAEREADEGHGKGS